MGPRAPAEPATVRLADPFERLRLALAGAPVLLLDLPAPTRAPQQVHRAVQEVLSRPEFRPAARSLLSRVWTWLLAGLASRGVVEEAAGRTAGEYRGEVGRNLPGAAEAFAGATELFERAWYGRRPTGAGEATRLRDLAGRVLERHRHERHRMKEVPG